MSKTAAAGTQVSYPVTLTNTGNGPDTFALTTAMSGGVSFTSVNYYANANGDGVADNITPITSTGNLNPSMLWISGTLAGNSLRVVATPLSGTVATGGSVGTTAGTCSRPTSTTAFSFSAGVDYSGVDFGVVLSNTLFLNGVLATWPGLPDFYAYLFRAGSGGQDTFSVAGASTPATLAWNQVSYRGANCNRTLEAIGVQVTAPLLVTAREQICLVVKQLFPSDAPQGAQNILNLAAAFAYLGAAPA